MYSEIIQDALHQMEPVLAGFSFQPNMGELIRQAVEVGLSIWANLECDSIWFSRSPEMIPHNGCIRI